MLTTIDWEALAEPERASITKRSAVPSTAVRHQAAEIVAAVRAGGDEALAAASDRHGGAPTDGVVRLPAARMRAAASRLDRSTRRALESAAAAIEACHRPQAPTASAVEPVAGVRVERRWSPLRRVGVYVPGGGAAYPSTVLMGCIPAAIAGVEQIAVASPADADGRIPEVVLAAAHLVGATDFYAMGGAQAIAALAYGTESVAAVDKIVGPGNAWVTAAKLIVSADVAIDGPAGPSEAVVLADGAADPDLVAIDLLCQAEHGADSPVALVTDSAELAAAVESSIGALLPSLTRRATIAKALSDHGLVVLAGDLSAGVDFINRFAPEHVSVHAEDAGAFADSITSAGSIFVGPWAPESAGDYATGANHILPTGGRAGTAGPLSVEDFGSWCQVQFVTRPGLETLRPVIETMAALEGLGAHAAAAAMRFREPGR